MGVPSNIGDKRFAGGDAFTNSSADFDRTQDVELPENTLLADVAAGAVTQISRAVFTSPTGNCKVGCGLECMLGEPKTLFLLPESSFLMLRARQFSSTGLSCLEGMGLVRDNFSAGKVLSFALASIKPQDPARDDPCRSSIMVS